MIGGDGEDWTAAGFAQLRKLWRLAIEHYPGDAGGDGGLRDLRHSCASCGLNQDSLWTVRGRSLNGLEDLLALTNCVILGKGDSQLDVEPPGRFLGRASLLALKVIFVGYKGKQNVHKFSEVRLQQAFPRAQDHVISATALLLSA